MNTETRNINLNEVKMVMEASLKNIFPISLRGLLGESRAHENILYTVMLKKIQSFLINKRPLATLLLPLSYLWAVGKSP